MTLEEFFKKNTICGYSPTELKNMMTSYLNCNIVNAPPWGIILQLKDNGGTKPLGCVIDHFTNNENGKKLKPNKSTSAMSGCYYIQKELGCSQQASPGECRECFLACLLKLENGQVYRIDK